MNSKGSYLASASSYDDISVLPHSVSAIQILPSEDETATLGLLTQLPEGAEVQIAGKGFNDRTLRVQCASAFYYLFIDDLELIRKRVALAYA